MAYRAVPAPATALVGRTQAVAAVSTLVRGGDARLFTLTGPGGVGKTRLGIAVVDTVRAHFADDVVWVPFAALGDPALVPATVMQALDLQLHGDAAPLPALIAYLREKRLLLLLDNCEHLIEECAALVAALLAACPALVVLATSRAPLRVHGEQEVAVPPLPPPDPARLPPLAVLANNPAVTLFVARAWAATGDFALTAANAPDVAEICARLDGLPLALELAAVRSKILSPAAIRARLDERLRLLTGGARDLPARQRTVRDTIAWSYDLLTPPEQALFRRLAVFAGGFTLEAAEAVGADGDAAVEQAGPVSTARPQDGPSEAAPIPAGAEAMADADVLESLTTLVDQSLVQRGRGADGTPRFTMLETIRAFAWEQLRQRGEAEAVARRHASYCRTLAEAGDMGIRGHAMVAWFDRLEEEHDNLRSALRWLIARGQNGDAGAVEQGLHLAGALWSLWFSRGFTPEGVTWLTRLLALPAAAARTAGRARALSALGLLQGWKRVCHEEELAIQRELGDRRGAGYALLGIAMAANFQEGDHAAARAACAEALALFQEVGDTWGAAWVLTFLADIACGAGDHELARRLYEDSISLRRTLGESHGLAYSLRGLGYVRYARGDLSAAGALYEESLAMFRDIGHQVDTAVTLFYMGTVAAARGDRAAAHAAYTECLTISRHANLRDGVAVALEGLADLAIPVQPERAARLAGAASLHSDERGSIPPALRVTSGSRDETVRHILGDEAWTRAWSEGRMMTLDEAVAYALEQPAAANGVVGRATTEAPAVRREGSPLTPREREVAVLIARGCTNRAIAAELVISERTATNHVAHILTKLGYNNRALVAGWAVSQGLLTAGAGP